MKIFTLLALILCLGISNGFGKVYQGLKVKGDFREMQLVVEDINPNKLLTREDILNTVQLRLFSNNIKTQDWGSEYFYVKIDVLPLSDDINFAYSITLQLNKKSQTYGVSESVAGAFFKPAQGAYGSIGNCYTKDQLLNSIKGRVDQFLVDYIESNMENQFLNISKVDALTYCDGGEQFSFTLYQSKPIPSLPVSVKPATRKRSNEDEKIPTLVYDRGFVQFSHQSFRYNYSEITFR